MAETIFALADKHQVAMQSDSRPTAKVGIDDELLDLIDLAQLHLCSRRDVVFQLLVVHRSPKAKTGGKPPVKLRRVDRRQRRPFERGDANAAGKARRHLRYFSQPFSL